VAYYARNFVGQTLYHPDPEARCGRDKFPSDGTAMQQVTDWLEKLGMSEYAQRFADNRIDFSVLPDLTDQDLEKLGVLLGDRRKMLRAIANLEAPENSAPSVVVAAAPAATSPQLDSAERRQVTVMFSDLVGSTALSARMDPEDLREVISAYQKCVAETVRRFDGFVAKYLGDGVLVYFGYPQAHEHDAERAVRAGLELIAAVGQLKTRALLQTRVGIATGLVVVGDLIGSGEAQERGIIGETPNLAARLQGVAEPNMVVIAESTRRLLGNLFELQDLGTRDLKGIPGPVPAWAAVRASSTESRFEALHGSGLTALVGRDEESELLLRRWSRAKAREGQVVLLSGEAGIGKSRLTAALLERLANEPHTRLRYFCSPRHTDSSLYPIADQMQRAAGLALDDTVQAKLDKLDRSLGQTSTSIQDVALFADMLSLPNDGRYPALDPDPQQRRQRTLQALIRQVEALSRSAAVLMIFEDAHWADPTSLEVLGRVVDRIRALRVLLLVTFRPEFTPPWSQLHVSSLTLDRLAQRDVDAIIDQVVGNKLLPLSIRQNIVERSDGIPLFIEEMTKAVLETKSTRVAEYTVAAVPSPALRVPPSLHASLMARLDRLGPAKEVAQIGAAIGREFPHALLASVMGKNRTDLQSMLDRLAQAGLLFRQGEPPNAIYTFKHALVQDAAYDTLLRAKRRELHGRIGDLLERQPSLVDSQPELLAHHYSEAGLLPKAVSYWLKAGQLAVTRSANTESVSHLTKALSLLRDWPAPEARDRLELEAQITLGPALIATKGYAASETVAAYERARALIRITGDRTHQDAVLLGTFVSYYNLAAFEKGMEVGREFLQWAEGVGEALPLCIGHRMLAVSYNTLGKYPEARDHAERALRFYDPERHSCLAWRYVHDLGVAAMCHYANAKWHLGFSDQSMSLEREALAWAAKLKHHNTIGYALFYAGALPAFRECNVVLLSHYVDQLLAHAEKHGQPQWALWGNCLRAKVLTASGHADEAIACIDQSIQTAERLQNRAYRPMIYGIRGEASLAQSDTAGALQAVAEALSWAEQTHERWMNPELWRIKGDIRRLAADFHGAEACYLRSIEWAKQQGSRMFELRSTTSVARLRCDLRKLADAREILIPIYKGFTEGFDTLDLKQAKELLDELVS
jgi:class 3 adenylate cyclase/tetratricopeptide (TPR) repeat protein